MSVEGSAAIEEGYTHEVFDVSLQPQLLQLLLKWDCMTSVSTENSRLDESL